MLQDYLHAYARGTPVVHDFSWQSALTWQNMVDTRRTPTIARGSLKILTWNIDACRYQESSEALEKRLYLLCTEIKRCMPHLIALQEVTPAAFMQIRADTELSDLYNSTKLVLRNGASFGQVTLVHRSFGVRDVFCISLPSHQKRDALVTDIELCRKTYDQTQTAIAKHNLVLRLVNMHLESMHHTPCQRPRQVATVMKYISILPDHYTGLLLGDMNPVQEKIDSCIPIDHELVDAWDIAQAKLKPDLRTSGETWGLFDKEKTFPPGRFDKFFYTEQGHLRAVTTEVVHTIDEISDHCGVQAVFDIM